MTETLQEFCDSRGVPMRVDREAGVIRGVKILGVESRNGRAYLPEALSQAASLYENAKVNVNHPKGSPAVPRDYQDRIGVIRRVTVATYEAEMNIVIFTDGGEIVAEVGPNRIRIEALDKGPGIPDIAQAMQPGFSTAPTWVQEMGFGAGMGLPNIQNCADEMKLESTVGVGTHLELIIYLPGQQT